MEEGSMDVGRAAALGVVCAAALAAGCGSGEEVAVLRPELVRLQGARRAYDQAVADCNKQAAGRYKIKYQGLPTDANQQRELLVRRLAPRTRASTWWGWT